MGEDGIKYETKTVRAVRGMETRIATKWEKEGWEVVSQSRGKLQTEITLRRPKPASPRMRYLIGGGVAVVAIAAVVTVGVVIQHGDASPKAAPSTTTSSRTSASNSTVAKPSRTTSTTSTSTTATDTILTPQNSAELAALLKLGNSCDKSVEKFAKKHEGRTIAFDGSIGAMDHHDGASTRYDLILGAGDFSETSSPGPAFQFRDVNTTYDLHYTQEPPETIGVGTNLHIKATVGEYTPSRGCLLRLIPVATTVR